MAVSGGESAFRNPYAGTPGSSTPSPEVSPKEGASELWAFFWLALVNTAIIAVSGLVAWFLIHR
ncbi:MAG TPA: hypothetical protein VGS23_09400 [Thermoplasmata archaeon]|nr:hypothetical protein [Thermoplasmata archaeon]